MLFYHTQHVIKRQMKANRKGEEEDGESSDEA